MDVVSLISLLVATGVGGIVSNRVDAAFVRGVQAVAEWGRQESGIDQELARAVRRSYWLALHSLASECRQDRVGQFPERYRGQSVYPPEFEEELEWLDRKLRWLQDELKQVDRQELGSAEVDLGLLLPDLGSEEAIKEQVLARVLDEEEVPACFADRIRQEPGGLLDRMCAFFAVELRSDLVWRAVEGRLLTRINARLGDLMDRSLSMADLEGAMWQVARGMPQIYERLEVIWQQGDRLGQQVGQVLTVVMTTDQRLDQIEGLLRRLVQEEEDPVDLMVGSEGLSNPFVPALGRVDDPQRFFGRDRELRSIFEILNGGSSVALIGEREMGKSSLLAAVCREADRYLRRPRRSIYLSLHTILAEEGFFVALCRKLGIEECQGMALERALERERVLLALDEVERISQAGFSRQIREQLRGWAEGSEAPLRLVVAARTPLDRLFQDSQQEGQVSPFEGICIEEMNLRRSRT